MAAHVHQHDHDHDHAHHDHARHASQHRLLLVIALTFAYMLAEAVGGWLANSLALISDAGHMFTDVAALVLSLLAVRFAARPATPSKTYGFYRLEILAALANGVVLIVLSLLIIVEAVERLRQPQAVEAGMLIAVSIGGLVVNLISAKLLAHVHHDNLNVRGAFLHVLSDLFGSLSAIVAGVLIVWRGWMWADPAFSIVISLLIIFSAWRLLADAVNILLEGTPSHINAAAVVAAMRTVTGVRAVHDLHIWTITSDRHAVTAHVVIDDPGESQRILRELRALLGTQFQLTHSTIQIEDPLLSTMVNISRDAKTFGQD